MDDEESIRRCSSLSEIVEISHSSFNVRQSNNVSRRDQANSRYQLPYEGPKYVDYDDNEDIINHEVKSDEDDMIRHRNQVLKMKLSILCSKNKISLRTAFAKWYD